MLSPDGALLDFTGCGNTLDVNDAITSKLVFDCLATGWRSCTSTASASTRARCSRADRTARSCSTRRSSRLTELADQLGETKLIAEAWDAGGLYDVGSFPGRRWSEWNGRFRDDVRRFVRGDAGSRRGGRHAYRRQLRPLRVVAAPPQSSINFVTCHDGFTLNDLVSYDHKHNEANGEANRDGIDDNLSWNCGVEGETADAKSRRSVSVRSGTSP